MGAHYDAIAAEDRSYIATTAERSRNENSWKLVLNISEKNGPMNQRDDNQEAKRTGERLYEEHGTGNTRIHPKDQVRQRRSQQNTGTEEGSERVDPKTGWSGGGTTIHKQALHPQVASSFMVEIFIME